MTDKGTNELEEGIFGLELKVIDAVVGKITTNASQVLEAAREKCSEYKDIEKFIGKEDVAKKEWAQLNKAMKRADDTAKYIKDMWMAPLNEFETTMKLVKAEFKAASGGLDELVKNVENREKDGKRLEIQKYFDTKNFDLVPLDRIFNDRWLNKTFKMPDIRKEIDSVITDIYANIKILERIPDYGITAKTLYLDTLDMAAALQQVDTMKANAERLAKEQAEREERERREQIERNQKALEQEKKESIPPSERMNELVSQALDIPVPEVEASQKPEIMEFTLRFRGTKEKLFALKAWMNENGIAYEKIG
jgi:F0F1-type ATP synthase membrane subunit b/b'